MAARQASATVAGAGADGRQQGRAESGTFIHGESDVLVSGHVGVDLVHTGDFAPPPDVPDLGDGDAQVLEDPEGVVQGPEDTLPMTARAKWPGATQGETEPRPARVGDRVRASARP